MKMEMRKDDRMSCGIEVVIEEEEEEEESSMELIATGLPKICDAL
jgi:hypothetical protein